MSNHHGPTSGHVLRRVSGQADRVLRCAPEVGVDYNGGMGGTDLFDFLRGMWTTLRKSKKWWKTLYHWILDTSMHNSYVLHKWVFERLCRGQKYKHTYPSFIKDVALHFIVRKPTPDPYRTPLKRLHTKPTPETGPSGEGRVCELTRSIIVCPGGDLEKRGLNKGG